ncbi:MAG: hypothetical protein Q9227_003415 [Pyrenula ochraceoflavens]
MGASVNMLGTYPYRIGVPFKKPLQAYWLRNSIPWLAQQQHSFTCLRDDILLPTSSTIGVVADLYTTLVPLLLIMRLRLPTGQKIGLYALFAVGFFVITTGIIRTLILWKVFWRTYDMSWSLWDYWLWTILQIYLAIICASAPALRPLVHRAFLLLFFRHYSGGGSGKKGRRGSGYTGYYEDRQQQQQYRGGGRGAAAAGSPRKGSGTLTLTTATVVGSELEFVTHPDEEEEDEDGMEKPQAQAVYGVTKGPGGSSSGSGRSSWTMMMGRDDDDDDHAVWAKEGGLGNGGLNKPPPLGSEMAAWPLSREVVEGLRGGEVER